MIVIICESMQQVESLVAEIEKSTNTKFVVATAQKYFNDENWQPTEKHRVFFHRKSTGKTSSIPFTGFPFIYIGSRYLNCHQGRDNNKAAKKKYAERKMKLEDHKQKQRRYLVQNTKKVDCPAVLNITRVATLLDEEFQIEKNSEYYRKMSSNFIKNVLSKKEKVTWQNRYYVYVSQVEEHVGHPIIGKLNHIMNIKNSGQNVNKHSDDDQENLQILIQGWKENDPEDNFFFRTCTADQDFLLCYQTKWQKRLLQMYGQDICLLDATYKTTRYSLAVFFLVVQTNVCNLVVAVFVVQRETTEAISEGLQKLREWNEGWSPGHFMVDLNKEEINAVEWVFPGCKAILCDFHRDKAWEEWTKIPDHGIQDQKFVLNLLRRIALSDTHDKYEQAVKDLEESKEWKRNTLFQQWFTINWLPQVKRWVSFFREETLHLNIIMNNGVERLNETFKHSNLNNKENCTVSILISIIVNEFIPNLHKKYSQRNIHFSSGYRKYNETVPSFLHNRPRDIVKHILYRYYANFDSEYVTKITDVTFNVKNDSEKTTYQVSLGSDIAGANSLPSCGCPDWKKHKLPCKHLCAVFKAGWSWEFLCHKYRDSPFLALDPSYLNPIFLNKSSNSQPSEAAEIDSSIYMDEQNQEDDSNKCPSEVEVVEPEEILNDHPVIKTKRKATTNVEELRSLCTDKHKSILELLNVVQDEKYLKNLDEILDNLKNDIAAHVTQEEEKAIISVPKKIKKRKRKILNVNSYTLADRVYGCPKIPYAKVVELSADLEKTEFRATVDVSQSEQKIALTTISDFDCPEGGPQWEIQSQVYI